MAKKSRVVESLSGPQSDIDPVRFLCIIETLYLHPMILGHFIQSGLGLGLLGCGLSPLDNCCGSSKMVRLVVGVVQLHVLCLIQGVIERS